MCLVKSAIKTKNKIATQTVAFAFKAKSTEPQSKSRLLHLWFIRVDRIATSLTIKKHTQDWIHLPAKWLECSERRGPPAVLPEVVRQELQSHHTWTYFYNGRREWSGCRWAVHVPVFPSIFVTLTLIHCESWLQIRCAWHMCSMLATTEYNRQFIHVYG